jgi:SAM-dependent methyltransferase
MRPVLADLEACTPEKADFFLDNSRDYEIFYSRQHLRRFRQIYRLIDRLPVQSGNLLDIGTTPFTFFVQSQSRFKVSSIDYSACFRRRCAQAGIDFRQHDFTSHSLPFEPQSFDVVVMTEVFEHLLADPVRILTKVRQLLKEPGYLVFGTPNLASLQNRIRLLFGRPILDWPTWELTDNSVHGHGHNRIYCYKELRDFMEMAGLRVDKVEYSDCLDWPDPWDPMHVRIAKLLLLPAKAVVPSFRWGIHLVVANT